MSESVKTLCPYCGVGCGLEVSPPAAPERATHRCRPANPFWKVTGNKHYPSSKGMVCVNGATFTEPLAKNRLKYPMLSVTLSDSFQHLRWDPAFTNIVERIHNLR